MGMMLMISTITIAKPSPIIHHKPASRNDWARVPATNPSEPRPQALFQRTWAEVQRSLGNRQGRKWIQFFFIYLFWGGGGGGGGRSGNNECQETCSLMDKLWHRPPPSLQVTWERQNGRMCVLDLPSKGEWATGDSIKVASEYVRCGEEREGGPHILPKPKAHSLANRTNTVFSHRCYSGMVQYSRYFQHFFSLEYFQRTQFACIKPGNVECWDNGLY